MTPDRARSVRVKPSAIKSFEIGPRLVAVELASGRILTWRNSSGQTWDGKKPVPGLAAHASDLESVELANGMTVNLEIHKT